VFLCLQAMYKRNMTKKWGKKREYVNAVVIAHDIS